MKLLARGVSNSLWGLAAALLPIAVHAQRTFLNPLFRSQDPYVTLWQGNYYYSDSDGDSIFIRKSPSLSGLATAPPITVWTASRRGPDGHANVWAPEIHVIEGKSYLYFAADYATNGRHRLYVLAGGSDPLGSYSPGATGDAEGQILESTGHWAIDPDVFFGSDGQLYLAWSCTPDDIGAAPQSLCLARMTNPLQVASSTVRVATPTEPWEMRTGPIEEGPVGFTRNGVTYLTYSASASWTTNDYTVGVLMNSSSESGALLDPGKWVKRGPILDHHGKSYGPGSVVFVPSPDTSELWTLYHGYDRLDCPAWSCRSIHMQKVNWSADGTPLLGYPMDPGVPGFVPSGDTGIGSGWGDSRLGSVATGQWVVQNSSSLDHIQNPGDVSRNEIFRGDLDGFSYLLSAKFQSVRPEQAPGEYGVYALYQDGGNHVEAFVDLAHRLCGTRVSVAGQPEAVHEFSLGLPFDASLPHTITIKKTAAQQFIFMLDGAVIERRAVPLTFGQTGLFAQGGDVQFREITLTDTSAGWGNAFGDAAEGLMRSPSPATSDGYVHGAWHIADTATASSLTAGTGWQALYQGEPNAASFTIEVEAQWLESGALSAQPGYGLIVCHDDRDNNASMWVNPPSRQLTFRVAINGVSSSSIALLPAAFDPAEFHTLGAAKTDGTIVFLLDGSEVYRQQVPIANGTSGIATEDTRANFRKFRRTPL
jgi:GH43 family beta-xylosidase